MKPFGHVVTEVDEENDLHQQEHCGANGLSAREMLGVCGFEARIVKETCVAKRDVGF